MKKRTIKKETAPLHEEKLDRSGALLEAMRCLQCFDAPCTQKCAAHVPIPRFIRMLRSGNFRGATEVVLAAHPFVCTCGEICPDENLCQTACTRGKIDFPVRIRLLHRFLTELGSRGAGRPPVRAGAKKAKVAVVGGGPAGLSCASRLAMAGVEVDLYEKDRRPGGILQRQIPSFRLPLRILKRDIRSALGPGVAFKGGKEIVDIEELAGKYSAVFVGAGVYGGASIGLPLENLRGVMLSADFLGDLKTGKLKKPGDVVIIGGGNVALDCGVAGRMAGARRAGIYYRRSWGEMPAWKRELRMAMASGVEFEMLCIPMGFIGRRGLLSGVRFIRSELGKPGTDGRRVPVPIPGSEFVVSCSTAVIAAGQKAERQLMNQLARGGAVVFDERTMKVKDNIFIGGDLAGRGTIVEAAGDGKRAASAILKMLKVPE